MNKSEFVKLVAKKNDLTQVEAEKEVSDVFESVIEALKIGEKLQIVGFGTFEVRERNERLGKDPRTGEVITIPASKSPAFKASKTFKDKVNS